VDAGAEEEEAEAVEEDEEEEEAEAEEAGAEVSAAAADLAGAFGFGLVVLGTVGLEAFSTETGVFTTVFTAVVVSTTSVLDLLCLGILL
jgi:hypothetical protein